MKGINSESWRSAFGSSHFIFAMVVATVATTGMALVLRNTGASLAAAILGLYLLHLLSVRFILESHKRQQATVGEQFEHLRQLLGERALQGDEAEAAEAAPFKKQQDSDGALDAILARAARVAGTPDLPLPRHFALGTVAIIRKVLTPAQVARVLVEQERRPGTRFGDVAVHLGLLTHRQLGELLAAQQEGLFTNSEIRAARATIEEFRRSRTLAIAS